MPAALYRSGAEMTDPLTQGLDGAHRHPIRVATVRLPLMTSDLRYQKTQKNIDLCVVGIAHAQERYALPVPISG